MYYQNSAVQERMGTHRSYSRTGRSAQYRIITSAAMFAAESFSPHDFLDDLCGYCCDGKGQHRPLRSERKGKAVHTGSCTQPGCDCLSYVSGQQFFYGS
jgi:hypothetical protein